MVKIDVGLNVGGLISGAAQGASALHELTGAMDEAKKKGNWDLYGQLGVQRDMLQANLSQFGHDTKTLERDPQIQEYNALKAQGKDVSKYTNNPEFMAKIGKLNDCEEKLAAHIAALTDAIQKGDLGQIQRAGYEANQGFQEFHQSAAEAAAPSGKKGTKDALLQTVSAQQIVGMVTNGINTYVARLDRSGIIGRQGSGDIVGADIEQLHKDAAMKSGIGGGVGSVAGGVLGGILGTLLLPGVGTAGGAALGSTIFGALGGLLGIGDEAEANIKATQEAYSKLWEQQIPGSMELNAMLGKNGGTAAENTRNIRGTFANAADAAAEFGFSAGEGIEAVKQGASQGLSEQEAIAAAKKAFSFERGIGADRQLALAFETRSQRFGMGNALGTAYQGSQASGMAPGQFNEFLRSMQRVFEDGISKGFVRGTQEMAGNMAFLSTLNNGSELWKGEAGAQRLSQMNAGLESATGLSSVTDILAFRGAQSVWAGMSETDKNKFLNVDGKGGPDVKRFGDDGEYINAMMILERGLTPELFGKQMELMNTAEMGSEAGTIERMRQMYGLNYTQSAQLYTSWQEHKGDENYFKGDKFKADLERVKAEATSADSKELDFLKLTNEFKGKMAMMGEGAFDTKMETLAGDIAAALAKAQEEVDKIVDADSGKLPDIPGMSPAESWQHMVNEIQVRSTPIIGSFFDTGGLFPSKEQKNDKSARDKIYGIFDRSAGDKSQMQAAYEAMKKLESIPKEVRERWNATNVINDLANASGINELLAALNRLIEIEEKNGNMHVNVEG